MTFRHPLPGNQAARAVGRLRRRWGFPPGLQQGPHTTHRPLQPSSIRPTRLPAFTLIELLIVIAIIGLLISILVPALGRAREISRQTVCGSNLRQFGIALLNYATDNDGWLPAKWNKDDPAAPIDVLANSQHTVSRDYGPSFIGIIRDILERRHTREAGTASEGGQQPLYLPDPKVMLCPSDTFNNPPVGTSRPPPPDPEAPPAPECSVGNARWPVQAVTRYADLPRTTGQANQIGKTFTSYVYVALWRNDDKGDYIVMADQSNHDDDKLCFLQSFNQEDNHGVRGINVLLLDSHVEWGQVASGEFKSTQSLARRYFGPIIAARPRWDPGLPNRSSEIQTVE